MERYLERKTTEQLKKLAKRIHSKWFQGFFGFLAISIGFFFYYLSTRIFLSEFVLVALGLAVFAVWMFPNMYLYPKVEKILLSRAREVDFQEEEERFQREHPHYEDEQFYRLCRDHGISSASAPAEIARILLLAENNDIAGDRKEILKRFNIGKSIVDEQDKVAERAQKAAKIAALRNKEEQLHQLNCQYIDYHGREKQIQMCLDEADRWRALEDKYDGDFTDTMKGAAELYMGTAEQEGSWALRGGFASGLAGGAAGLAVALDTQRENEQIRQRNSQLQKDIFGVSSVLANKALDKKIDAQKAAEHWENRAQMARNKLVEDLKPEKLLKLLNPQVKQMQVSESGAVLLDITYQRIGKDKLKIYETVPATVDGFFNAVLWVDGKKAGNAVVALPWNGADSYGALHCVCTRPEIKTAKQYDVTFEPNALWAVEI